MFILGNHLVKAIANMQYSMSRTIFVKMNSTWTFPECFWWGLMTITTVGYDVNPDVGHKLVLKIILNEYVIFRHLWARFLEDCVQFSACSLLPCQSLLLLTALLGFTRTDSGAMRWVVVIQDQTSVTFSNLRWHKRRG